MNGKYPKAPLYLVYGNQVEAMQKARDEIVATLLEPDLRGENLSEYSATSNRHGVELKKIVPEIADEFDLVSFIPEAPKVAIVNNPLELYSGGGKRPAKKAKGKQPTEKTSSGDPFYLRWLKNELPKTGNHLILMAYEDEAAGREINDKGAFYQAIARIGHVKPLRDAKAFFRIEDAMLGRRCEACMQSIRDLWKPGKGDAAVYGALVRCLRFMMQARIAQEKNVGADPMPAALYFPQRAQFSLTRGSDFVRKKYMRRPIPYTTPALLEAYAGLLEVYRALRPRPTDVYVADPLPLLERTLMKLFASPTPGMR